MKKGTEVGQNTGKETAGRPTEPGLRPGAAPELRAHVGIKGALHAYGLTGRQRVEVGPFSLEVRRREFLSLVGPHGCGKSTLLRMIAGLLAIDAGRIEVSGAAVKSVLTDIGLLFPEATLLGWRSVLGNVMVQAELRGLDLRRSAERAKMLIASMGLSGLEERKVPTLPAGMAQRVAICRALVHSPELLLADDPFRSLDLLTREQASMDLQRLWVREPITVLYATSQIEEAVQLSNRVAVLFPDGSGVAETIDIELPYPRLRDKATTPLIVEYSSRIRTIFHALGVFP